MAPPEPGTPLYVHVPFCVHKCPYCDFFSVEGVGQDQASLVATLLLEAELKQAQAPQTVFIGGGTPSYLDVKPMGDLLEGLDARTGFRSSAQEVTAECNPESLTSEKIELMLQLGVNRFSIGVQSLEPATLEFFERPHDAEGALAALERVRSAGVPAHSVDLIHGAPTESPAAYQRNLLRILDFEPPHVSAYGLIYEPGTPLHERLERGSFEARPEDDELACLEITQKTLKDAGYHQYEVSNFTKSAPCAHNVNYWHNGPYLGIGPSAVSHIAGRRFGNARSINRWQRAVHERAAEPAWDETLEPRARLGETWWLGLRLLEGLDPNRARETAGWTEPDDPCNAEATKLIDEGLLERAGARIRLTPKGLHLADHIGRRFLV